MTFFFLSLVQATVVSVMLYQGADMASVLIGMAAGTVWGITISHTFKDTN